MEKIMTANIMTKTFAALDRAATYDLKASDNAAAKQMAAANKKASGEGELSFTQFINKMEGKSSSSRSEGGNTKLLKAVLGLVQKRATGEGSDAGSAKQVANLLRAVLPFIKNGKGENSDSTGSKETNSLLKALAPLIQNSITREKAADEESSGMSMKSVRNLLKAMLALVEQNNEDEDDSETGSDSSDIGNLLKALLPFINSGASTKSSDAGSSAGKDLSSILSNFTDSIGKSLGGKSDTSDKTTSNSSTADKTDTPAPVTTDKTSGTDRAENTKSEVKDGMLAANKAIPLLMKLLDASQVTAKGDQSFTGQNLLEILSSKDGNKVKLSDSGFAGGKGPAGEFSSEDGKVKIANKDGSNLGTNVEVDLKNLFSNKGDMFSPAKDKINELATLNITYTNGKQELVSATGADSDRNGNQTVKLGNGKDQIKSIDFALPKGATEKSSDGSDNKSDAGIGAVRMTGAKTDPSAVKESILELLPSILGGKETGRASDDNKTAKNKPEIVLA
jgi:hypothetical protein